MASAPSAASPVTTMSGSSSRMRRKPRRTRLGSSTNRTEILFAMRLLLVSQSISYLFSRNGQADQSAGRQRPGKLDDATQQFRALPHCHEADPLLRRLRDKALAMILHFQLQGL